MTKLPIGVEPQQIGAEDDFSEWWTQFGLRLGTTEPEMVALAAFRAGKARGLEHLQWVRAQRDVAEEQLTELKHSSVSLGTPTPVDQLELAAYLAFIRGVDITETMEKARAALVERALTAEAKLAAALSPSGETPKPQGLFRQGAFTLSGGALSPWKIDCDALTDDDLDTLAAMLVERLPAFGSVEGVARGGLRLATALEPFVTEGLPLLVDDVLTTGGSLERQRAGRQALGAVLFARGACPVWVTALFTLQARETPQGWQPELLEMLKCVVSLFDDPCPYDSATTLAAARQLIQKSAPPAALAVSPVSPDCWTAEELEAAKARGRKRWLEESGVVAPLPARGTPADPKIVEVIGRAALDEVMMTHLKIGDRIVAVVNMPNRQEDPPVWRIYFDMSSRLSASPAAPTPPKGAILHEYRLRCRACAYEWDSAFPASGWEYAQCPSCGANTDAVGLPLDVPAPAAPVGPSLEQLTNALRYARAEIACYISDLEQSQVFVKSGQRALDRIDEALEASLRVPSPAAKEE